MKHNSVQWWVKFLSGTFFSDTYEASTCCRRILNGTLGLSLEILDLDSGYPLVCVPGGCTQPLVLYILNIDNISAVRICVLWFVKI